MAVVVVCCNMERGPAILVSSLGSAPLVTSSLTTSARPHTAVSWIGRPLRPSALTFAPLRISDRTSSVAEPPNSSEEAAIVSWPDLLGGQATFHYQQQ